MSSRYYLFTDYLLLVILITISGFPIIDPYSKSILVTLFLFSAWEFTKRGLIIDKQFFIFFFIFIVLSFSQFAIFQLIQFWSLAVMFLKILTAYLIVKIIGKRFIYVYIRIMVVVTVISFIFWVPAFLSDSLKNIIISNAPFPPPMGFLDRSYLIYHLNISDPFLHLTRNCGPFWEPGVFGGFLMITLIFNSIENHMFKDWKNIILVIGILTTFSTTNYIALTIYSTTYAFVHLRRIQLLVVVILVVSIAYLAFDYFPFLGEKINKQYEYSHTTDAYVYHRTRFSSALLDFDEFITYPLTGKGKFEETRFGKNILARNSNNGTTDFLVVFGIIGFLVYFFSYYKSYSNYLRFNKIDNPIGKYSYLLIIITIGFAENYFMLPFFWGLCFIRFNYSSHAP